MSIKVSEWAQLSQTRQQLLVLLRDLRSEVWLNHLGHLIEPPADPAHTEMSCLVLCSLGSFAIDRLHRLHWFQWFQASS